MKTLTKVLDNPRILIYIAPLILFSPIFLLGKAVFWGTPATQFVPWWDFAWQSILSGQFPFWNPLVGMGAPLMANYQTALFYPVTWIYFLFYLIGGLKTMAWAISLVISGHLIWSGIGTARLLQEFKVDRFGQTIGALAFSLSGYLVARAGFLSINATAAWIPWLLLFLYRLANKQPKTWGKLVAVLSMMLLAGHAQTAWHALLLGGTWISYWAVSCAAKDSRIRNLGRSLAGYLGTGLAALGISAIQLLPTAEYLMLSQRASEYGYETAMTYSFWPWRFLTLLVPDLFGNPARGSYWGYGNYWEDALYLGLLPILLALGFGARSISQSIRKKGNKDPLGRQRLAIFLVVVIFVSFLLALGNNTAIFPFLYRHVPGFGLFQAPTRYTIMAVMSLALLAGFGADELDRPLGKKLYATRLAVAGCIAVMAGAFLAGMYLDGIELSFLDSVARAGLIGFLAAFLALMKPDLSQPKKNKLWILLAVLLVSADLISAGWGLNPGIDTSFYDSKESALLEGRIWMPQDVEYDLKFNRFFQFESFDSGVEWEDMQAVFLPNLPMLRRIAMVNNFDPLLPGYYQSWMDSINAEYPSQQVLGLMQVSNIVNWIGDGNIALEQVDTPLQLVRVVGCAEVVSSLTLTPQTILDSSFNLERDLIVTSDTEITCDPGGQGRVEILERKNGYLRLLVDLEQDSWITWSQVWYPGWKYRIDGGRGVQAYRVNYLFQGAPVPATAQQVEFVYRPASILWGGMITCLSLLGLLGMGRIVKLRHKLRS